MTATPMIMKDDGPNHMVIASVGCPDQGVASAKIPRRLLQQVSDIRLPGAEGVEGRSIKTNEWGDLTALGARRVEWI